ncbi:AraC family transcriptional regulator [Paenibacillus flagellatus]|uniref:AraC family transcriptional regulator n=1 Tax=Paenibacillus flagellatus TaxID=2211139 RepID=A0A2V5KAG8_9BACL|nr:AraC family transcriptional regulator [Paenibacillus flagellatus]PYI56571.1 AraC family transcriptional regulator [Paenibacillus flagellatus]
MECLEWTVAPPPQLVTVGRGVWQPGMRHFARTFGLYDILFVRSGCLYMAEEGREYAIGPGQLLTLEPEKRHVGYKECEVETELFWMHVRHEAPQGRVAADDIPWSLVLRKGTDKDLDPARRPIYMPKYGSLEMESVWPMLEEMVRLHDGLCVGTVLKLQAQYFRLLASLQELVRTSGPESRSGRLAAAVAAYLRSCEREPFKAELLERRFHYHIDYLSRCLKKHTGMSPVEYVRHIRIEKARRLLEQSPELTVKQIAEQVCMPDPNYFARMFRKETGMSPAAYRKRRHGYV